MELKKVYKIYRIINYFTHNELHLMTDDEFETIVDAEKHLEGIKIDSNEYVILTVYK